jgi:hypothetical protein
VEKCKIHPTKDIDMLCEECQLPICSKCATQENHRGHKFIDLETVYADKMALCLNEISKVEEYFLPTSQDLQKEIKGDATKIEMIMDSLKAAMKVDGESLKRLVDTVVSENMHEANNIEQSLLEKLRSQDTTFDEYISYLYDHLKEFNGYLSSTEVFNIIQRLSDKSPDIRPIPETTKPVTPVLTVCQYSKDDVAKLLGKIIIKDTKGEVRKIKPMEFISTSVKSASTKMKQDRHKECDVTQTLSLSPSVTEVRKFIVPGVSRTFHISMNKTGKFWVSDEEGNLVQSDLQGSQIQKIQTRCGYGYHTVTQDEELIFTDKENTDSDNNVIKKITRGSKITKLTKTGDWTPISIHSSHINGDMLVGKRKDGEAKVTRYNKTGKELQNIQMDSKGQELYKHPLYITENINGDVCVSDHEKHAVVVVNQSGHHRFSYTGQGSGFWPWGICTDVLGHILVCESNTVRLLDQDGRFLFLLLTPKQNVYCPISVCVDDDNNLYVGQYNTKIVVYKYLQ